MIEANTATASETPGAIIQRRLAGLAVLLLGLVLLSLLLRQRDARTHALDTVVIPLQPAAAVVDPGSPAEAPVLSAAAGSEPAPGPAAVTQAAQPPAARPATPAVTKPVPKPLPPVAKPRSSPPSVPPPAKPVTPKPTAVAPRRWFVVVGSYKDPMAAQAIGNRIKMAGFAHQVSPIMVGNDKLNRVRAGPFTEKDAAEAARVTLIVEGLTKAAVVGDK